jgi:hypothetical protein
MKSRIDHIDEFIDGFLNGSIVSMFQTGQLRPFLANSAIAMQLATTKSKLFDDLIPQYMSGDTKKKEELATEMVQIIMKLRMYGLVENSPISLNELQFLRSENTRLKEEKKVLEEKALLHNSLTPSYFICRLHLHSNKHVIQ